MFPCNMLRQSMLKLSSGTLFSCHACQCEQRLLQKSFYTASNRKYLFSTQQQESFNSGHASSINYKKHFLYGAGISLGLYLISKLKSIDIDNFIPSVTAATPFSWTDKVEKDTISDSVPKGSGGSNRKQYNFIADAVEKVSDSVVYIEIKDHRRRDNVGNMMTMTNGSGFIIEADGLILTNAHVVSNKPRSSTIKVRLANGKEFEGVIEELDALSDLALVRINCKGLKPAKLGVSKDTRAGEFVVALGSPLSLSNTITAGVVSSVGRGSKELGLMNKDIKYIQTDAAITFGNSGGPLINLDGEVIGINSMKVTVGISFAIPIDYAKDFISKASTKKSILQSHKEVSSKRRYLGITMLSLDSQIIMELQQAATANMKIPDDLTHGIFVWRIVVGSPAYQAGLNPGDIISHINGKEVHSSKDVYSLLESGGDLIMVVIRGGQRYTVTVAPEE